MGPLIMDMAYKAKTPAAADKSQCDTNTHLNDNIK